MGYYAGGSGDAIIKENVNRNELRELLNKVVDEHWDMEYVLNDDTKIYFWENNCCWHEEDTMEFFNQLTPYITEGCAEYKGDDDCTWRYVFQNGEWIEQNGTIYYSDEDMIKYLETKGYTIEKGELIMSEEKTPVLCGFVWCHGKKDFGVWETNSISNDDRKKIEKILEKYVNEGTSVRSAWDDKISDLFAEEY